MVSRITIAVDAMSGDRGCEPVVRAAEQAVAHDEALSIVLVGRQSILEAFLMRAHPRIRIEHAPDVVTMAERPSSVLRHKQYSSMAVALHLVRDGHAHGCVSAGNTGALMALGRSILRTYAGIERPAIIKRIPAPESRCHMLDLGANVEASAEHLFQYAVMGSLMVSASEGIENPRVALLNVGREDIKGNEQVRLAAHMLAQSRIVNYTGYVEGNDLFRDEAEVVVCDGFVGNVALKTGEGVAMMLMEVLRSGLRESWYGRFVGWLAKPVLARLLKRIDPARHNGASLIGLQGVLVKSHGHADETGLVAAIHQAVNEVEQQVPQRISAALDEVDF